MSVHRKVFVAHIFNFFIPLLSLTHVELNRLKRKTFAWCQVHFPVNSLGFGKQWERAVFAPTPKCMLIVFKVLAWKMETFLLFQTWSVWNPDTFHLGEQRQQVRGFFLSNMTSVLTNWNNNISSNNEVTLKLCRGSISSRVPWTQCYWTVKGKIKQISQDSCSSVLALLGGVFMCEHREDKNSLSFHNPSMDIRYPRSDMTKCHFIAPWTHTLKAINIHGRK